MFELRVVEAGTVPYDVADDWQRVLHARRLEGGVPDVVLMLEHPHVYTLGRRFKKEHLTVPEATLSARGIEVFESDRGGSITYHGPGQLVAYPILDLRRPDRALPDAIKYLRQLEEAIIRTVRSLGVVGVRREGLTGVWVGNRKLAAIGVNVSRGVSRHGLAINVSTDLSYFTGMIPCGIPEAEVTSLSELLGSKIETSDVSSRLAGHLANVLHRRVVGGSIEELGLVSQPAAVISFPKAAS